MAKHTGERPYACTFCPKTFRYNGEFYTHRINKHPAEYAKERGKYNVLQHRTQMDTDIEELVKRRYRAKYAMKATIKATCEECGLEMLASSLTNHMLYKHGKEKHEHVCKECNKAFAFPYMLLVSTFAYNRYSI